MITQSTDNQELSKNEPKLESTKPEVSKDYKVPQSTDLGKDLDKRSAIQKILDDATIADPEGNYYVNKRIAHTALQELLLKEVNKAIQGFCADIASEVSLEFAAGGRYPGHIIDPWTDVVRPIIYKRAQLSKESNDK
jgi:hypothetical protein